MSRAAARPTARETTLSPEAKPERGAQHAKLQIFAGLWKGDGIEGTTMTTTEEYRWLPGEFFLELHFDQQVTGHPHIGVGFIGFDAKRGAHFARMADNLGYERMYDVHETKKGEWTFTGERERATYKFHDGDGVMDVWWEYTKDGSAWDTLCKFRQKRAAGN